MNKTTIPINIGKPTKTSTTKVDKINIKISIILIFFSLRTVKKAIFINENKTISFVTKSKFP